MPAEATAVAGIVLAAGTSTRMGRNKLLLELDGETLVRRAARQALEAGLDPVVVVLGHDAERTGGALEGLKVRTVLNPDYAEGMSASLRVGLRAVPSAPAAIVVLADMPFVTVEMLRALRDRYAGRSAPLVVSRYGDDIAPPMLYDRSLFDELLGMAGDGCGKRVYRRHEAAAEVLQWPEAALADVDGPGDLERLRARPAERNA